MNLFKSRKFRQGSVATVITVLVVVLIVIVNMVAGALSTRYSLSLDLTSGAIFTLSQESIDFLKSVEKDVTVYVLNDEDYFMARGTYYQQAGEVIKRYAQQSPRITVKYVDIVKDPTFTSNYPDLTLNTGNILVECGTNSVVLTAYDLFNTQMDYSTYRTAIVSSKAEQALSSAILNVTSDKKVIVSVLQGHNEVDITDFTTLLQTNNYEVVTQNLMTEDINPDATIAIMCAPSRDISEEEARKLDAFLSNGERMGKTLFYLASASVQTAMPVLDAFLEDWGIRVNSGVVFENSQSKLFQMNVFMTLADYSEDEYSKSVQAKSLPMAIPNARPLEFAYETKGATTTKSLLDFSVTAGVRPNDAGDDWDYTKQGASGPILALGVAQRIKYEQLTPLTSNVLVSGTEMIVDPYLLGSTGVANGEYLLGLLNTLAEREDVISIQSKTVNYTELGVTGGQIITISVILAIV
ncbi:GldG family protein, partial [Ruminococcaceae bacterium OttesenSCG-928-L11]|nr:GldG family protein [Ruminococcaceae bacterium OttesenSCG-928-L11]